MRLPMDQSEKKVTVNQKRRAKRLYDKLSVEYPGAHCALNYKNPWQLLVATILSAQCTDVRVNAVTPSLFKAYPGPGELARADSTEIEKLIKSTGFYRNKTKSIQGAARAVTEDYGGKVPDTMEQLIKLPGVARKTANVVLGNAFDKNIGVVVDTHISRVSYRLGLTDSKNVSHIERDLMVQFPQKNWTQLAHLLISHGRNSCKAPTPICSQCVLGKSCPKIGVGKSK